jgi:hypothetical protein
MVHEVTFGPCPCPLGNITVGRVPMEVARGVFGIAITFGALVILLILLNRRDRRASRLRHTVLEQLALPELRGRVGVRIQCAVFSRRRAVIVDLLAGMPYEVWSVFTRLASRLPRRVRLVVHGAPDRGFTRPFALETTTGRLPSHAPRASLVTKGGRMAACMPYWGPRSQTSLVGAVDVRPAPMAGVWEGDCADYGLAMLRLSRPSKHWREGDEPHSGAHGFL